jgi:hypothetical protein
MEYNQKKRHWTCVQTCTSEKKFTKEYGEFGILAAISYSRTRTFFVNETGVYNVYDEILNESDTVSFTRDSTYQTNARNWRIIEHWF